MNLRIKELYLEAAKWADQQDEDLIAKMLIRDEKFAELIVRECTNVVGTAVDQREPASTYVGKIKQHFGVE